MVDIAALIEGCGAVRYGEFELSSGATSNYYVDKYVFETDPDVLGAIAVEIAERLSDADVDVVAGPELGAVPLVTAVSLETGLPAAFIRKEGKGYGTDELVEGSVEPGMRVALLEDVTTTGNTVLDTARRVEGLGAAVARLVVVVDRDQGAESNLVDAGFPFECLVRVGEDLVVEG